MTMTTLTMGYSAANTACVKAAGGHWDAMAAAYVVPETATALIAMDRAAREKSIRSAERGRAASQKSRDAARTAGRLAGYSDTEIDAALSSSGGDDL